MKHLKRLTLLLSLAGMVLASSCVPTDDEPVGMDAKDVSPSLLVGRWQNSKNESWYKKYTTTQAPADLENYKYGSDWTVGETNEDQEGTEFYYKVEGNRLMEQYPNMSGYLPRVYTLMTLTSSKLEYFDQYSEVYTFTK